MKFTTQENIALAALCVGVGALALFFNLPVWASMLIGLIVGWGFGTGLSRLRRKERL